MRRRPKRTSAVHFGLFVVSLALFPRQIGYQDLGALIARQPSVSEHWRQHVFATTSFGSVAAASFGFAGLLPSPMRTQYASLDLRDLQLEGGRGIPRETPFDFPQVNRETKTDRLIPAPAPDVQAATEDATSVSIYAIPEADFRASGKLNVVPREAFVPFPEVDLSLSLEANPDLPQSHAAIPVKPAEPIAVPEEDAAEIVTASIPRGAATDDSTIGTQEIFFGSAPIGEELGAIERWQPGEVPIFAPAVSFADPDIKQTAVRPEATLASLPLAKIDPEGASVAPKGVVAEAPHRLQSPADRLKLSGAKRAKAEKCLANAVYFESRGESLRGQEAVAQVVMNRVFSDFYPNDVCGVVYQNAHRHLACQFTFACDNVADVVKEPELYEQAKRIASDTLDGKIWVAEVGKATHYHAYWVHPNWIREMNKLKRIGVHTFYRPRNWGNGADEPHWGDTSTPTKAKL